MGIADGLYKINNALSDKPDTTASSGGKKKEVTSDPLNKAGYGDAFGANPNIAKMKELGLSSMPEDGQEGLDRMYNDFQAKQKSGKKKSKMQTMYKDSE